MDGMESLLISEIELSTGVLNASGLRLEASPTTDDPKRFKYRVLSAAAHRDNSYIHRKVARAIP